MISNLNIANLHLDIKLSDKWVVQFLYFQIKSCVYPNTAWSDIIIVLTVHWHMKKI